MTFASPWFLLGLLGVGIPIAIHLIRKQRAERIVLPTARFLKQAPKKTVFFQAVQQWLLLAMRAAIIGLLAFGFARPLIIGAAPDLIGVQPRSLVILLDTSMSMRYADRFEAGKAAAIEILSSLKPADEAAVISFADRPGQMKSLRTDTAALKGFVRSIAEPGFGTTDYLAALRSADQVLRGARFRDRSIYLVSDYYGGVLPAGIDTWQLSPGVRLDTVSVGSARTTNLTLTGGHVLQHQDQYTIVGQLRNLGTEPLREARVFLSINGSQLAEQTVNLRDGSEARVEFPYTPGQTGLFNGRLTVVGDRFEADNVFHFSFRAEPPLRVLVVSDRPSVSADVNEAYWFQSALELKTRSTFLVDTITPDQLSMQTLAPFAVVALLDVGDITAGQAGALNAYVRGGGGLLLAPADRADSEAFNRDFGELTPTRLRQKHVFSDGTTVAIARVDKRHALVRALQPDRQAGFDRARFHGYWSSDPAPRSEVIMQFDNGQPALAGQRVGNGRVLLFTSSLDPKWNDFPLQVSYLPLLHETMRYLAGSRPSGRSYRVGDAVPLVVPPDGAARVISPDGRENLLRPGAQETAYYGSTDLPGIYEIRTGSQTDTFVVNASVRESNLKPMDPENLRAAVIPKEIDTAAVDADDVAQVTIDPEDGGRFWWWVLLAVLGLGFLETFLANRTYR